MLPLWRLTRNRYGRALHDRLDRAGVTVAVLDRWSADAADPEAGSAPDPPPGVSLRTYRPDEADPGEYDRFDELAPDDRVLAAETDDGETAGYLFVAGDRAVRVPELHDEFDRAGAYAWGMFVPPAHRRRGVGTALVAATVGAARRAFGADAVHALVAADNRPSRRIFRATGFAPAERLYYVRLFGREWRRSRPADG